jgi:hypothetical protein
MEYGAIDLVMFHTSDEHSGTIFRGVPDHRSFAKASSDNRWKLIGSGHDPTVGHYALHPIYGAGSRISYDAVLAAILEAIPLRSPDGC